MVENQMVAHYESVDENSPRHSDDGQPKDLQQRLNWFNTFLLLLVMSYVGSILNYYRCLVIKL